MNGKPFGLSAMCLALTGASLLASVAAADDPLYLQPPHDEITLDDNNAGAILRVQSLNLPGRKLPPVADRKDDLEIELIDRPGEKFAVAWVNITGIKFFEQLVLAEADQHVKAGRFDEAEHYYGFLEAKYPKAAGLKEAVETFLYTQIGGAFRAGRHDEALALLVELYARNPQRQGLATAYERVTIELVKARLAAENYRAARGLLRTLGQRFPDKQATVVAPYEAQLQDKAQGLLSDAQAAASAGKLRESHLLAMRMLEIWPTLAGGRELAQSIHEKYPVIVVGVVSPLGGFPRERLDDWAAVRTSRALGRPLVESALAGSEGGPYRSALGEIVRGDDLRQITLRLKPQIQWNSPPRSLTGYDVARSLLAAADPQHPAFDPLWAGVLAGVEVRGSTDVQIDLRRPQPLPEAWLQMPLWLDASPPGTSGGPLACGPYRLAGQSPPEVRLVRQAGYFAASPTQPAEIVERTYPDSAAALRALRRGEISVVDRLAPWDVPRAAGREVIVRPYAVPTVHVLVPNPSKPLLENRILRRALVYGIDRQGILRRGLLGGQDLAGCDVLSGPFPRGGASAAFAYAYNAKIEPRPYEPATALVLARLAIDETLGGSKSPPKLTLAHPAEPVARAACQSIARQLELLNLQVATREVPPGESAGDYDLLYAELAIRDPLVDVWRVLGPGGLAGSCSPAMLAALRAVEAAPTKQEAAARLQAVHRLAAAELPVIPLWQLTEHFAYHPAVKGIADKPTSLYQDVEQWQVDLRIAAE